MLNNELSRDDRRAAAAADVEDRASANLLVNLKGAALEKFRQFFHGIGGVIYDYPFWFIGFSTILALVSGLSFLNIQFETSADNLYALPASQARADLAKQASLFGAPPRISMVFVINPPNNSSNVLTKATLNKLANLDHFIHHKMASSKGGFTFEDVCYRQEMQYNTTLGPATLVAGQNSAAAHPAPPQCMKMTALDLYRTERLFGQPIVTRNWPYVPNLSSGKITKADLALTDARVQHLASGTSKIFGATGFLLLYHASGESENLEKTLEWEQAMIDLVNHDIKPFSHIDKTQPGSPAARVIVDDASGEMRLADDEELMFPDFTDHDWKDFRVFVNAERSWQDELARSTKFDSRLIRDYVIAYIIIAIYMIIFNRTINPIRSKSACGFLGSVSALFGYAAGGGICYWAGMRHCPTMHASPFLVLAIGLDNTFVVLNFYTLSYGQIKKPKDRCRNALTDSGLALFITTFTSVLSFAVGAVGPYTAVRNFCIQTGMGLCGGFVYNIVFFYPFLCLEARAESNNQIFFLPGHLTQKWLKQCSVEIQRAHQITDDQEAAHQITGPISDDSTRIETMELSGADSSIDPFGRHKRTATLPTIMIQQNRTILEEDSVHLRPRKSVTDSGDCSLVFSHDELRQDGGLVDDLVASAESGQIEEAALDTTTLQSHPTLHKFLEGRNMFQIASLQWQFKSRFREFDKEIHARGLDLSGDMLDDARSAIPTNCPQNAHEWISMPASQMLNCDLKTGHRAASMGIKLLDEPIGNKGQRTRIWLMRWIGPALTNGRVQKFMLLGMISYMLFFSVSAFMNLTAGLELENLSPPDSYLREAFAVSHSSFPIFPKQTFVLFTTPNLNHPDGRSVTEVVNRFESNNYGARETDVIGTSLTKWLRDETSHPIEEYVQSLGEIQWWTKSTFSAFVDLDAKLRAMPEVQDVLNGMLLFYEEHATQLFGADAQPAEEEGGMTSQSSFYKHLNHWLRHGVVGQHVRDQFVFDHTGKLPPINIGENEFIPPLVAFRMMIFNYNFLNSYSQSHYMLSIRDLVSESSSKDFRDPSEAKAEDLTGQNLLNAPLPNYAALKEKILGRGAADHAESNDPGFVAQSFMDTFLFFETDATIWRTTLLNMLTAFISILIASSILMEGWTSVALVTIMICSVDIGVFGGMALLGLQLNILTMILLVLSIGFSVDYTVHVIHTFCHTIGRQTNARAVETMVLICSPMTHGALSTLLGILPIYFRAEYVLQNFFWMMALVILFGFLNGVIFLPIIMSRSKHWLVKREHRDSIKQGELTEDVKQLDHITSQLIELTNSLKNVDSTTLRLRKSSPHTTVETLGS